MRADWSKTAFPGICVGCGIEVPAGRGWVVPRPQCLRGRTPYVTLCRSDALATADVSGLDDRLEELGVEPPVVEGVPFVVSKYQADGAEFLAQRWRALLTDDKGLGKTAQALLAIPEDAPVVVVCPAQVKSVWAREFKIWRPEYQLALLNGRNSWCGTQPGYATILNYDILPKAIVTCERCWHSESAHGVKGCKNCQCRRFMGRLPDPEYIRDDLGLAEGTVLIADEAHKCKSASSKRTRRLRFMARGCERAWGLTASPIMNRPDELWTIYGVFDLALAAWGSKKHFSKLFRNYEAYGRAPDRVDAVVIQERRSWVELGRSADDVGLELPELRFETRVVPLDADARKLVDEALSRAIAARKAWEEFKAGEIEREQIPARREELSVLSHTDEEVLDLVERVINLREWGDIAAEISTLRRALACAKIPGALSYAQECADDGEVLVAFSAHVLPAEALGGLPGWACMRDPSKRAALVDRFQRGELKGLAGTIRASGEGITLHRARLCLMIDQDWTPEANDQAIKRIHRRGQNRGCLVTTLLADHPLDKYVGKTLARKSALIQAATRRTTR